jgi:two-component system NtrC family sensor kinase
MNLSFFNRLSIRVLLGSVVLLLALFGFYSYFTVRYYNDQIMNQVLASANRMSDVIKQSMHYSMLLNRKEDVYQIVTMIGTEPGVEGIRIYNKRGEIMFSTNKEEEHSTVNMNGEACFACHDQGKPLESLPIPNRTRIYESPNKHRILGLINPIRNEPVCSNNACHAHRSEQTVLGVLDVRMSLEDLDRGIIRAQNTTIAVAIGMSIIVALVSMIFLLFTVLKPVQQLMKGATEISSANLDYHIIIRAKNELGRLAHAFNEMTQSLRHEKAENLRWSETLEERIRQKTDELNAIHKQMIHIEKMASLGKLSATVAHELNNPLEAILTYAKLIGRRIRKSNSPTPLNDQTLEDIELIVRESDRCGTIVKNLLLFSRKQPGDFSQVEVKRIIEKASDLVRHHCAISNVQLHTHFEDADASLLCDENQIQQALVALFVNAVESMADGGTISVGVAQSHVNDEIIITVADTGVGIFPEDLPHIFEPFFTTKENGKGVGLGLSVVYGIIERHNGTISVSSEHGKGTLFTLKLPRDPRRQHSVEKPITDSHTI